jgi:hypothetical protein
MKIKEVKLIIKCITYLGITVFEIEYLKNLGKDIIIISFYPNGYTFNYYNEKYTRSYYASLANIYDNILN